MMDTATSILATVFGHGLWGGALILLAAYATIDIMNRHGRLNAATRFSVWTAAVVATVVLHLALVLVGAGMGESRQTAAAVPALEAMAVPTTTLPNVITAPSPADAVPTTVVGTAPNQTAAEPGAAAPTADGQIAAGLEGPSAKPQITLPAASRPFLAGLGVLWILGLLVGLVMLARALVRVRSLKAGSRPLASDIQQRIRQRVPFARRRFGLTSSEISSPVAAGFARPQVLVPAKLVASTDAETLDPLLLHEVAHLERWDDWTLLMQRLVQVVLWFNPAVWLMAKELRREREAACDEWVVSLTKQPETYARSLSRIIELRLDGSLFASPGLAAEESEIVSRVKRLLEQGRMVSSSLAREKVAVAAGLIALVAAVAVFGAPTISVLRNHDQPTVPDHSLAVTETAPERLQTTPEPPRPVRVTVRAAPSVVLVRRPVLALTPVSEPAEPLPPNTQVRAPETEPTRNRRVIAPLSVSVLSTQTVPNSQARALRIEVVAPAAPAADRAGQTDLTSAGWIRLFRVAAGISSSGDRARLLVAAIQRMPSDPDVHAAFLNAAASVSSSGDRARVLLAFIRIEDISAPTYIRLIDAVKTIPSSGDRARIFMAMTDNIPADEGVEESFLDAVEAISSSGDREKVLRALMR
jgi:bla regulator protein blaR1